MKGMISQRNACLGHNEVVEYLSWRIASSEKIRISCDSQCLMYEVPVMDRLRAGKGCHDGVIEDYGSHQLFSWCLNGETVCFTRNL